MTILGTYKGRHRKPNRRGRWLKRGAAVFAGLAPILTIVILAAIGALPATTVNAAPAVMFQPAVTAVQHLAGQP